MVVTTRRSAALNQKRQTNNTKGTATEKNVTTPSRTSTSTSKRGRKHTALFRDEVKQEDTSESTDQSNPSAQPARKKEPSASKLSMERKNVTKRSKSMQKNDDPTAATTADQKSNDSTVKNSGGTSDSLVSNKKGTDAVSMTRDDAQKEDFSDSESSDSQDDDSEDDGSSSSGDSSSGDDNDDDDDDELDELLNKAQEALRKKSDNDMIKLSDDNGDNNKATGVSLPKLQPGISIDNELYIRAEKNGIAKISPHTVTVVDSKEAAQEAKNSKKTLVALKTAKEDTKPLTRKERQQEREKTTGKGWFDMPLPEITPEIKRDLQILKMRHVLDRKRHYKKMGKKSDPKYFQIGTIVEGATEFFSSRINKKDRKQTFAEELLANDDQTNYYKRKYLESQDRRSSGGKKHFKKLKAKRS